MEKERISVFQLVVLLYVCRSFNLLTATLHDVGAGYGAVQLAAYPLAAVFQLALMLPVWLLTRETGKGLGESAKEAAGRWGLLFSLLGAGYLLTTTALTLSSMGNFLVNTAGSPPSGTTSRAGQIWPKKSCGSTAMTTSWLPLSAASCPGVKSSLTGSAPTP